jgi:hypothetical protein
LSEIEGCYKQFAEIEVARSEVLFELSNWSPELLSFRPATGSWNAIEVLDHVVKSETGMTKRAAVGLQNPHPLDSEARSGIAALERALRSHHRFQVPPGARSTFPDAEATLTEVIERWEETRKELGHTLDSLSLENAHHGVFRHPVAGWMTFGDVLRNISAHLYHHRLQLRRICTSYPS